MTDPIQSALEQAQAAAAQGDAAGVHTAFAPLKAFLTQFRAGNDPQAARIVAQLRGAKAELLFEAGDADGARHEVRVATGLLAATAADAELINALAGLFVASGNRLYAQGHLAAAVADYGQGIALREALCVALEPLGQWVPAFRFDLAGAYSNRSLALVDQGQLAAAVVDLGHAIALREGVRADLEPMGQWMPASRHDLVTSYSNRGVALVDQGQLAAAVADYDDAIALGEGLRTDLEPIGQWMPALRRDLAMTYINRGNAVGAQGQLAAAVADYDEAIALGEGLRADLEPLGQWMPEFRNDLATTYSNRGNALGAQGQLAAAVADYGQAIVLRDELRADLEPVEQLTPASYIDLATVYRHRGNALGAQGQLAAAVADYGQAIDLMEELGADLDPVERWTTPLRRDLAGTYSNRGAAFVDQGQLAAAVADLDQAIVLWQELRAALEPAGQWAPAMFNDLAAAYSNRGTAFVNQGQLSAAVTDFGQAIALREGLRTDLEPVGQWLPDLRSDLAGSYSNRGTAFVNQGQLSAALTDFGQALDLMAGLRADLEPLGQWTLEFRDELATAYNNRSNAFCSQGQLAAAIADCGSAIALREKIRGDLEPVGRWMPALRRALAGAYGNRGNAFYANRQFTEAMADFGQAIALMKELHSDLEDIGWWTPAMRNGLAGTYSNRGTALVDQGQLAAAVADFEQSLALNAPIADGILVEADRTRFLVSANLARLLDHRPDPLGWARAQSQRLARFLEQVPVTGAEQSHAPELYRNFALFHARWLAWCVRSGHLDVIPEILAIVQGREIAAEVLDQLQGEDPATPEAVRAFHRLRLELRKLNARIEAVITGGKGGGMDGPTGLGRAAQPDTPTWDEAAYNALLAEHRQITARLAEQRAVAAKEPGYESLELPYQQLALADLQQRLAVGEALLLLVHPEEGEAGVLLIRAHGEPHWQPVPQLPHLALAMRAFNDWHPADWMAAPAPDSAALAVGARRRLLGRERLGRCDPSADWAEQQATIAQQKERLIATLGGVGADLIDAIGQRERYWDLMRTVMEDTLWAPLQAQLEGIVQLTAIPHGDLHLLPLAAGAPETVRLSRYPGVAFLAQRRGLYGLRGGPTREVAGAIGVLGFAGEDEETLIPLAEAEAAALARLYQAHERRVAHPSAYPNTDEGAELLHIACHGGPDPQQSARVALFIAKRVEAEDPRTPPRHVLNQDAIIVSKAVLKDVYFSACLGGQTVEGLSGTPAGLISACFRCNARWVAGALVKIPDQWAMVLAVLTHQALLVEHRSLPDALAEGKRRLAAGEWFLDTGDYLAAETSADRILRLLEPDIEELAQWAGNAEPWDEAACEALFAQHAVPLLLSAWAFTDAEIDVLHPPLRHYGPQSLATPLAKVVADRWPSRPRIPPEPALGTLIHGLVVFGEPPNASS